MNNNPVLILENSSQVLESMHTDNKYILEGVFAEFDKKNNNGRIYEANEYIPHLEYLQQKISEQRLTGELDHPEKFDVSLQNVSHIIEKLEYDKNANVVRGQIRLLNTPAGKKAQALIDGGVKLSISSRAAGIVESNNKVKIKKIFSYDIVGDPGFSIAVLKRVNESLAITDENIAIFEMNDSFLNNIKDVEMKSAFNSIISENQTQNKSEYIDKEQNNKDNIMLEETKNLVTVDQMNKYSKLVKENFNKLEFDLKRITSKITEISENKNISKVEENDSNWGSEISAIQEKLGKIVDYLNYTADEINKQETKIDRVVEYSNYLAENLDSSIVNSENLKESFNKDINALKTYSNYLAESTNKVIGYTEHLAENLNASINHTDYIAEHLEVAIQHNDHIVEKLNASINHTDYVAEKLNNSINYQNYLGENLDISLQYQDYLGEKMNNAINYSEYIADNTMPRLTPEEANESLSNKIDKLIESVETSKTISTTKKGINLLSESNKQIFENLASTEKKKVIDALNEKEHVNEEQVIEIWKNTLGRNSINESLIAHMPQEIRPIWESMTEEQRGVYRQRAALWDLTTPYKIKNFWYNQNIIQPNSILNKVQESLNESEFYKKLNESQTSGNIENTLGYSRDSINSIKEHLLRRKNS
jgi:ABC-type transporter Mla subunit MlaD